MHLQIFFFLFRPIFALQSAKSFPRRLRVLSRLSSNCKEDTTSPPVWLTFQELDDLAKEKNQSHEKFSALHADVFSYGSDCKPMTYRINQSSDFIGSKCGSIGQLTGDVQEAQDSAEITLRWCSNFVQELNLCPWAKLSLKSKNAIRIKIVPQSVGLEGVEAVIRDNARELIRLTNEEIADINTAITFIVVVPRGKWGYKKCFQFEGFYEFCSDLEDQLFDEASEAEANNLLQLQVGEESSADDIPIGDEVTMAPFHPNWCFSTEGHKHDNVAENPLNYEKKSPYPTISLVRTSVIIDAGEEATSRIGAHNEKILNDYGANMLKILYGNIFDNKKIY